MKTNNEGVRTTDREFIHQRVLMLMEMRAAGNLAGMIDYTTEDIVFNAGDWSIHPYETRYEGKAQVLELARSVDATYENLESHIDRIVIDGEEVALQRTATIRKSTTGRTVVARICLYIRFRDGLVCEFAEYPDTLAYAKLEDLAD